MIKQIECEQTEYPVCPYCGNEYEDAWELGLTNETPKAEIDCPDCGEQYDVNGEVTIEYTTKPKGGWDNG